MTYNFKICGNHVFLPIFYALVYKFGFYGIFISLDQERKRNASDNIIFNKMGEFSKRIGDSGEKIVEDFLKLVGWNNIVRNFDIPTIDAEKYGKKSHGIDGYFHYVSPMISNTIENIIISSKFSTEKYPATPAKAFKEYFKDLSSALESFKHSEIKSTTLLAHNQIDQHFDRGVLFWFNNTGEEEDLTLKLQNIEIEKGWNHDGVFLVDNKRMAFIYDTLNYPYIKYRRDIEVDFIYFSTGLNNDDKALKNGKILPVQYITSSILPLRIFDKTNNQTTILISSSEPYSAEFLMKLMGLAKNIGSNVQVNTIICFPDYKESVHLVEVNQSKQIFSDSTFTERLTVENYNSHIAK